MSNERLAIVPESVIHAANMLGGIATGNELTDLDYQLLTRLRSWALMFDGQVNNLPPPPDIGTGHYQPPPVAQGWQCPVCKTVWAPSVTHCRCAIENAITLWDERRKEAAE